MESIKKYQQIILQLLTPYTKLYNKDMPGIHNHLFVNKGGNHFIVLVMGWHRDEFTHDIMFHIEIKDDGKVWLYENRSDCDIYKALTNKGILKGDLVVGYVPEYVRERGFV